MGRDLGLVCKISCCSIKINQILTRCFLSKSQFAPPIYIHRSLVESDDEISFITFTKFEHGIGLRLQKSKALMKLLAAKYQLKITLVKKLQLLDYISNSKFLSITCGTRIEEYAEVVGSNPTRSISFCEGTTVIN
jgi:hypothetical protein